MPQLTELGQRVVVEIARRHDVSADAALTLLEALAAGHGSMAQFNHRELGGAGQWSRGGMTMVGDMFDTALKARVDALCTELAAALAAGGLFVPAQPDRATGGSRDAWWPEGLGTPSASGAQNGIRYACFPDARRVAIERNGEMTLYDSGEHRISGVSQQQASTATVTFTSQHGTVRLADLAPASSAAVPGPTSPPQEPPGPAGAAAARDAPAGDDPLSLIQRLAELHRQGVLSAEEFAAKKAELLARI